MNNYEKLPLSDPLDLFHMWFQEAQKLEINDPDASCLATADSEGRPSARMVLLKTYGPEGFKFHTNSESRKGLDLRQNPQAELCFYWKSLRKQVRIFGTVEMISAAEADEYFTTRPRARQIGAWASAQSKPMENEQALNKALEEYEHLYRDKIVPRPPYWNGYRLNPVTMEFWIGHEHRLHDRFIYHFENGKWSPPQWLYP